MKNNKNNNLNNEEKKINRIVIIAIIAALLLIAIIATICVIADFGNDEGGSSKTTVTTTTTTLTTPKPEDSKPSETNVTTTVTTTAKPETTTKATNITTVTTPKLETTTTTTKKPETTTTTTKKPETTIVKTEKPKVTTTTTKNQVTTTTTAKKPEEKPSKEVVLDVEPMGQGGLFESGSGIMASKMVLDYYNVNMDLDYFYNKCLDMVGRQNRDYSPWEKCMGEPKVDDAKYYAPVIKNAINTYLQNKGISNLKAKDITGCTPEDIYKYVQNGKPIIVVANKRMRDFAESGISWTLPNGEEFVWKVDTSYWVVIGTSSSEVIVINANSGREKTYEKEKFEKSFIAYESQAILVE